MRKISYVQAINEALHQMMERDEGVFVIGVGVNSPWYVGQSCKGLHDKFGDRRVIDTPVSENGITGIAIGAAMAGMRPILVHPRMDFMLYAMDQIVNQAGNWHYMFGGKVNVPVTIRGIINRGGEQAAQHSQALHAFFAHVPGLKVVMPSTPYDAKGLLVTSVEDENPVIYIDDRWLYEIEGDVPEDLYSVEIGKGAIRRKGDDVTIVAISYMAFEAEKASEILEEKGISSEVIDLRSVKPFDKDLILESVKKTGRLVVADVGWRSFGASAEILASIASEGFNWLKTPPVRVALPDAPAPSSSALEKKYYPDANAIVAFVERLLNI
jgi:pyruvate dehydrogenase E1 component beta subunit